MCADPDVTADPPLSDYDKEVIQHWRSLGYVIPVPELSPEALNQLNNDLRVARKRFDDFLQKTTLGKN